MVAVQKNRSKGKLWFHLKKDRAVRKIEGDKGKKMAAEMGW